MDFIKNCGVMLEPQEGMTVSELISVAKAVEKMGYGYLFRSDHFLPTSRRTGLASSECWVTLGAVAASTKTLKFGPLVTPIGFRNPTVLARMACTLHSFSSGRLQLGVGAGWYEDEYLAHGLDFPSFRVRTAQFHEALEVIKRWTEGTRVDFDGRYFSAHVDPSPRPKGKLRLIIGGRTLPIVREAAEFADEWNTFMTPPENFPEILEILRRSARDILISQMGPFVIGENVRDLRRRLKLMMRSSGVDKDIDTYAEDLKRKGIIVEQLKSFPDGIKDHIEEGFDRFYFQIWKPSEIDSVELLAHALRMM